MKPSAVKPLRCAALVAGIALSTAAAAQDVDLESSEARAGYSIGVNIGLNLESQGVSRNIDVDALLAGITDGLSGDLQLSEEEIVAAIQEFTTLMEGQARAEQEQQAQAGRDFLAENAQREGVQTTESGLQYEVLEEAEQANAPSPDESDTVTVHYHGELVDGTVFDSSIERGEPISFPLSGVIPGWTEGLQLMQVGDKYRFYIPPELAYGNVQAGPIPPNSPLVFDVELLGIEGEGEGAGQ